MDEKARSCAIARPVSDGARVAERGRMISRWLTALVMVAAGRIARADDPPGLATPVPPGLTTPTPSPHAAVMSVELEGAVRVGIADIDYVNSWECDTVEMSGVGWFVDGELGARLGHWTISWFVSWTQHHDVGTSYFGSEGWNVGVNLVEVGLRATWHRGRWSLGAGVMPLVTAHLGGPTTYYAGFINGTSTTTTSPTSSWTPAVNGGELHVAYDLGRIHDRFRFQLFGSAEYAYGNIPGAGYDSWTIARTGIGVAF